MFAAFCNQPEAFEHARTAASLQSRWQTLQRQVQKYLTAERIYYAKPEPSGTTEVEAKHNIMVLFRRRSRKVGTDGNGKDAPPLKSLEAVEILRACPKFCSIGGPSRTYNRGAGVPDTSSGTASAEAASVSRNQANTLRAADAQTNGVLPSKSPSKIRPLGIKKALRKSAITGNALGLSEIAAALHDRAQRKEKIKKAQLRFSIISALPAGEEKTRLLLEMLDTTTGTAKKTDSQDSSAGTSRVSISSLVDD